MTNWPADKIERRKVADLIPYARNGTTMIAAHKHDRVCHMMELDPKYCDVIIKRWCNFTGKDAINEETGKLFSECHDAS